MGSIDKSQMTLHVGTKLIRALPMNRRQYNDFRGWQLPENENGNDEGFLVEDMDGGTPNTDQFDGYVSWSPKEVFENAYKSSGNLTFGAAVTLLKAGLKVSRSGWNGVGMFLYYVPENKYPASGNLMGTMKGVFQDDMVPYGAYIAMKTAQDKVVPWLASQTDVLAEDWCIVE